jgi:hypothetical protein
MAISLPKQPTGDQFEEGTAAWVRAVGYFTENRTVLHHEGRDVLELDIVASPASKDFTERILIDAKKGTAGFADIFKMYGWRIFLKIPKGCIVHGSAMRPHERAAFDQVCPKIGVNANTFDPVAPRPLKSVPTVNGGTDERLRRAAYAVGWYQLVADRLVLEDFRMLHRQIPNDVLFSRVREYRRACHLAFFEADPFRRALLLYNAYKSDPGISGTCIAWQAANSSRSEDAIGDAVRDTADFPWIQHVMCLETRARILIIKNGMEAALQSERTDNRMAEFWKAMELAALPDNFRSGFERASKGAYRTAIPYILQLYTELFGGFLLDDTDRADLASLAGVPTQAVAESLDLLDVFYPTTKGWHTTSKELRMMKWIPAYRRGIGAFMRRVSRDLKTYSAVAPKMYWLLEKWHNSALAVLERELKSDGKK